MEGKFRPLLHISSSKMLIGKVGMPVRCGHQVEYAPVSAARDFSGECDVPYALHWRHSLTAALTCIGRSSVGIRGLLDKLR